VRRESATVVALVGDLAEGLLAELARSPNVSVVRPVTGPRNGVETGRHSPGAASSPGSAGSRDGGPAAAASAPGWEAGALLMREAARRHAPYVLVAADPLAGLAAAWRTMWDVAAGPAGAAGFEQHAAETLAAWRAKRFELPDYYLVVAAARPEGTGPDLYLGPLRAVRPRRVAVAPVAAPDAAAPDQAARVLDALRSLQHGPWWPPLDQLVDTARDFYAGGLAETQ
jgi:hypothetical protein